MRIINRLTAPTDCLVPLPHIGLSRRETATYGSSSRAGALLRAFVKSRARDITRRTARPVPVCNDSGVVLETIQPNHIN